MSTVAARTRPTPVPAEDAAAILNVLARYAQVVDNRDWDHFDSVFTADAQIGSGPGARRGHAEVRAMVEAVAPYHPHYSTDTVLHRRDDGRVRAWTKYFIVRTDGTAGSGDYLDTLVRTTDGWRIQERAISRGHRAPSDPGGAAERTLTTETWLHG